MTAHIVVSRPSMWSGRAVAHKVFVEGAMVAKVRNASQAAVPGPAGTVRVQTRVGGSRSQEVVVTVADGAAVYLVSKPNTVTSMAGGAVGGVCGVAAVALHIGAAGFLGMFAALMAVGLVLGQAVPGLFVSLTVTGAVPAGMPYPQPPYPQPAYPQQPPYPPGPGGPWPAAGAGPAGPVS